MEKLLWQRPITRRAKGFWKLIAAAITIIRLMIRLRPQRQVSQAASQLDCNYDTRIFDGSERIAAFQGVNGQPVRELLMME